MFLLLSKKKPLPTTTNNHSWTVRFVDYFALLGPTAPTLESIRDSRIPDDLDINPILLDSIPREPEHPDMPIPPELAAFCCPNGMKLRTKDSMGGVPQPQHFAQVLAVGTVGTTVYCYCVTFYDPMKPNDLINMFTTERNTQRQRSSSTVSNGSTTSIASRRTPNVVETAPRLMEVRTDGHRWTWADAPLLLDACLT